MSTRWMALAVLLVCANAIPSTRAAAPSAGPAKLPAAGCLPAGDGYLRAHIRGALVLDIDLRNAQLECQGDARPDGSALRVSFVGPVKAHGRIRIVFGISGAKEGRSGRELPTNLTLILEGQQRMFATRGTDKCTADSVSQQRIESGATGAGTRVYRVVARGFCIAPVSTLRGDQSIVVESFDFAGRIVITDTALENAPLPAANPAPIPAPWALEPKPPH